MNVKNNLAHKMMVAIGFLYESTKFPYSYKTTQQLLYYLDRIDYKIETLRKQFSYLKKDNLIEIKEHYRKPYPTLTQKGKLAIKTRLPYKKYDEWDGKWRMVIFDIPEIDRKSRYLIRYKLKKIGFAKLQKSSYISPYPVLGIIDRFALELGARQYLRLIEVEKIDYEKKLISKIWKLEEINKKYQDFLSKIKKTKKDKFWPFHAKELELEFSEIYKLDPHIPEKFLPEPWHGQKAYETFKKISNSY